MAVDQSRKVKEINVSVDLLIKQVALGNNKCVCMKIKLKTYTGMIQ